MLEKINVRVDVITIYRASGTPAQPYKLRWNGKEYLIKETAYHHREKVGGVTYHIFSVTSKEMDFKLRFDPQNMYWFLEEVTDGFTN